MTDVTTMVTEPGIYDLPDDVYHADPVPGGSLSSTGARRLLPPSCPAIYRHERDNGWPRKREFDLGHAAHEAVVGGGADLHVVGADTYNTKAAQKERDDAYARGAVPLLPREFDQVQAMATAVRAHPIAGGLFADGGAAEQSLFWVDAQTGVWCRGRPDWLSQQRIVDYKTTTTVFPGQLSRTVDDYGYHLQAAMYLAGAVDLDLVGEDAEFLFVFQAKTPPYLVQVVDLDDTAMRIGRERMRRALEIYRDCSAANMWPAYSDDIETVSLPGWTVRTHERDLW